MEYEETSNMLIVFMRNLMREFQTSFFETLTFTVVPLLVYFLSCPKMKKKKNHFLD